MDAFKTLIKIRDGAIRDLQKAEKSLGDKCEKRDKSGGGEQPASTGVFSFGSSGETLNQAIAKEEAECKVKRRNVEGMARALFFSEIDRFNEDRGRTLTDAVAHLAAAQVMVGKKTQKLFTSLFPQLDLDLDEESRKTKEILALQEAVGDMDVGAL